MRQSTGIIIRKEKGWNKYEYRGTIKRAVEQD